MTHRNSARIFTTFIFLLIKGGAVFAGNLPKDELDSRLQKVIAQPKFQYTEFVKPDIPETPGFVKWLQDILRSVGKFWDDIFTQLGKLSSIFLILVIVVVGGLIVFLVLTAVRNMNFTKRKKIKDDLPGQEILNLDYQLEIERGKSLMRDGRFKEAVDMFLNAVWLYLSGDGTVAYDKSRTDREYLARLKRHGKFGELQTIVRKSEIAVFYKDRLEEDECREILGQVETFLSRQVV
ncbi:MAG: hypothetical protein HPY53_07495 [Brevinematales bacterium]|nr:hypothetical protein [Brevinematales bacterium]